MVPTFTCGLLRSNFSLAMSPILALFQLPRYSRAPRRGSHAQGSHSGADVQDRTGDLVLTKDALCQLSYIGGLSSINLVIWTSSHLVIEWLVDQFANR